MSETSYDEVQYFSHPYRLSHPDNLYTIGKLFGLNPEDVAKAKILELGCASGGNIIPVACNFPKSEFVGIDLSQKQIEMGQKDIDALGLKNIKLKAKSILDMTKKDGKFDYIICHGIYSWVGEEVRNKIFEIFRDNLSTNGIAYISYNTFPGWNMVQSIRDMMLYHTQGFEKPEEKAGQARGLLNFIVDGLGEDKSPYATFLRQEINLLNKQPDYYLLHDHMEEVNHPVYFYKFMQEAAAKDLDYLSDASLNTMFAGNLPPKFSEKLSEIKNIIRVNQYMDFIRNQRFRMTLLCSNKNKLNRNLNTKDVEQFYLTCIGKPIIFSEDDLRAEGKECVYQWMGITLTLRNPISKIAMDILQHQDHKPIHYQDLVKQVMQRLKLDNETMVKQYLNDDLNLLRLALGGIIILSSYEPKYEIEVHDAPKVSDLLRHQASSSILVTNQRHESIRLSDFERMLISYLDGKTKQEVINQNMIDKVKSNELSLVDENKQKITDENLIEEKVTEFCKLTYEKFAKSAMLVN